MSARILVVDDDDPIRNMVIRLLQFSDASLELEGCEDGLTALKRLAEQDFQLLLVDYTMPGISGVEVIESLRKSQRNSSIPVIMLTARSENYQLLESLPGRSSFFLAKPFEPQELLDTVGFALGMTLEF